MIVPGGNPLQRQSSGSAREQMAALRSCFSAAELSCLARDGVLQDLGGAHHPALSPSTPDLRAAALPELPKTLVWAGRTAAWVWTAARRRPFHEVMTAPGCRWDLQRRSLHGHQPWRVRHMRLQRGDIIDLEGTSVTGLARTARDLAVTLEHPDDVVLLAALAAQNADAISQSLQMLPASSDAVETNRARRALRQALALSR